MTPLLAVFAAALAAAISLLIATRGRVRELEVVAAAREAEAREERAARTRESAAAAAQRAQLEAERAAAADKLALVRDAERKLGESFEALSQRALRANNDQFLQLARESLGKMAEAANGDLEKRQIAIAEMVRPVRDSLEKVDEKIQKLENARTFAYASLSEQVRSLRLRAQRLLRLQEGADLLRERGVRERARVLQLLDLLVHFLQRVAHGAHHLGDGDLPLLEIAVGRLGHPPERLARELQELVVVGSQGPLRERLEALGQLALGVLEQHELVGGGGALRLELRLLGSGGGALAGARRPFLARLGLPGGSQLLQLADAPAGRDQQGYGGSEGGGEDGEERGHAIPSLPATVSPGSDIAPSRAWISWSNLSPQNPCSAAWTSRLGRSKAR